MGRVASLTNHIALTSVRDIKEICQPLLEHLPIKYFGYSHIYPDGSKAVLGSWDEKLIVDYNKMRGIFADYEGSLCGADLLPMNKKMCFFESDFINNFYYEYSSLFKRQSLDAKVFRDNYNIIDRLFITEKRQNVVESFIFSFERGIPYKTFLLNNFNVLIKFESYFRDKASLLIGSLRKNEIVPAWRTVSKFSLNAHSKRNNFSSQCGLLTPNNMKQLFVPDLYSKKPNLTKKEFDCAKLIVRGLSAREIAEKCFVSKRTIETHIANIKQKLAVRTRSELIEKLLDFNILNREIF